MRMRGFFDHDLWRDEEILRLEMSRIGRAYQYIKYDI